MSNQSSDDLSDGTTPTDGKNGLTYADAGVDIDAGNALIDKIKPHAKRTSRSGMVGGLGGFGGLFDLKDAGYNDPILVAANDGVGTKVKVAIETGLHKTVGIDLVAMCVNDLVVQGAEPLFFLDYIATAKLEPSLMEDIIEGIAEGCVLAGCGLIGGETAEMPGLYSSGDYDLAGFSVGAAERGQILPREDLSAGDVLIGLASSGVHSNGFSLVRKVVENGGFNLLDKPSFGKCRTLGEALLEPTRIYVKPLLKVIRETGAVKALAHITGGGLTENLPRVLPDSLKATIDLDALTVPPVFSWLAREGGIEPLEMLRTFNCGVGMVMVVASGSKDLVLETLKQAGEQPFLLGELVQKQDVGQDSVTYSGDLGLSEA